MANNVVPFGKYKGQPVEAMQADRGYIDWLLAQPWFREQHQNIYTLIINNFTEPSETPEHNALQALFLDNEFAEKVIFYCYGDSIVKQIGLAAGREPDKEMQHRVKVVFEVAGADVHCCFETCFVEPWWSDLNKGEFKIEVKPTVGDDYPAILRQIKNTQCRGRPILFLENYLGSGATREQFVAIFVRSGISVAFYDDVIQYAGPDQSLIAVAKEMGATTARAEKEFYRSSRNDRLYGPELSQVDGALAAALRQQGEFFEEALGKGDAGEIRVHGEALCRGWVAAAARLAEAENARKEKAAAETAAYLRRQEELRKEMILAQARGDEQRRIDQAMAVFPGAKVIRDQPKPIAVRGSPYPPDVD